MAAGARIRVGELRAGPARDLTCAFSTHKWVRGPGGRGNRAAAATPSEGEEMAELTLVNPNSGFVKRKVLGAGLSSLVKAGCVPALLAIPTASLSPLSLNSNNNNYKGERVFGAGMA